MNNENDFGRALDIIRKENKNRPIFGCCGNNGATGPTGPTDTYKSVSEYF